MISRRNAKSIIRPSELPLAFITMLWGTTFLIIQHGLTVSGPLFFVGSRFAFAALLMGVIALPVMRGIKRLELIAGGAIGLALVGGIILLTYGLQWIPSSKSAFITALYVPMVPVLQWAILRQRPPLMRWVGIAFAFLGLILLAGPAGHGLGLGLGEILTLLGALVIAAQIVLTSKFAGRVDVRRVTVVQVVVAAVVAFALMPVVGEPVPAFSWPLAFTAGGLGIASVVIQLTMNWAQREVTPTRATLIYSAEPVWAGVFGRMAGELLPSLALVGAALIVTGVIISEVRPRSAFQAFSAARGRGRLFSYKLEGRDP